MDHHDCCFLPASSSNRDFDQGGIHKEARLLQLHQHDSQIEELTAGRFAQDSECPDEGQIAPSGFPASVGIMQQKLTGPKLLGEGDGK